MTVAQLTYLTDLIAAWYQEFALALGDRDANTGAARWAECLRTKVVGGSPFGDPALVSALLPSAELLHNMTDARVFGVGAANGVFMAMNRRILLQGSTNYRDIASYADYINRTMTPRWQALLHPAFRTVYTAFYPPASSIAGAWGQVLTTTTAPPHGMGHYTMASSTFTPGAQVNTSVYYGAIPMVAWEGVNGEGLLVFNARWRRVDGSIVTGQGTVYIPNQPSGQSFTITPPEANVVLVEILSVLSCGATGGVVRFMGTLGPNRWGTPGYTMGCV